MSRALAAIGAAVVALGVGAAVASGAVSLAPPTPTVVVAAQPAATPTIDMAAAVQLQQDEPSFCQCGK